jgi:hypothetical protein
MSLLSSWRAPPGVGSDGGVIIPSGARKKKEARGSRPRPSLPPMSRLFPETSSTVRSTPRRTTWGEGGGGGVQLAGRQGALPPRPTIDTARDRSRPCCPRARGRASAPCPSNVELPPDVGRAWRGLFLGQQPWALRSTRPAESGFCILATFPGSPQARIVGSGSMPGFPCRGASM